MSNKFFIGGIVAVAVGATILQGAMQTPAPRGPKRRKKKGCSNDMGSLAELDLEVVFPKELLKFQAALGRREPTFTNSYINIQKELESEQFQDKAYVVTQITLGLVMSILAANCCLGVSNFIPKGISFDLILRCELDALAIIAEEKPDPKLTQLLVELYQHIKNGTYIVCQK